MTAACDGERELLAAALRGDAGAGEAFARSVAEFVWTACVRATRGGSEAEAAFRDVMGALCADRFARLKAYDGRARVRVYLTLVVRDLLSERIVKLLALDACRGWSAFEAFFGEDMRRLILRMLPSAAHRQDREDAYQSICEALLKNDLKRLRAYSGRGSPSGFILRVIENLTIDHARTIASRRRPPAAIQRLAELDRSVFRLLYWEQIDPNPAVLIGHLTRTGEASVTAAAVAAATRRVRKALPARYFVEAHGAGRKVDLSVAEGAALAGGAEDFVAATPEDELIAGERAGLLEEALAVLQQAMPKLDAAERLYLQLALSGAPTREIARLLGCPAEEVYRMSQRVKRRLRDELGDDDAVKKWRLSV